MSYALKRDFHLWVPGKFFLAVGKAGMIKLTSEMKYSYQKLLGNKVSAHLEAVATCYAHRNIIFTQKSKFRPILVLVLAPASMRFAESKNVNRACLAVAGVVYTIRSYNICMRALYGPKMGEFPVRIGKS